MKFEAEGQSINFFDFDHSAHDKIMLSLSGGTDSALLLYMICKYLPEKQIICATGIDLWKDPFVGDYAAEIIEWTKKQFDSQIIHETYTYHRQDPGYIEQAEKEISEAKDKTIFSSVLGHAKQIAGRPHLKRIRTKHDVKLSIDGQSSNPPLEVQKKLGFEHVSEIRRNKKYDVVRHHNGNIHHKPLVNVDKKFIAGMYEQFNLLDSLFPITMSCIGDGEDSKWYTEPCGKCYWCYEKKWAFGCYDRATPTI